MWDELIHADRQTDMKDLIVAIRSYVNAPKNNLALIDTWKARMKRFITFDECSLTLCRP
jgi:hypothetical protein